LPESVNGKAAFRSITVDGEDMEFSDGFSELHTRSYEEIIAGRGFGVEAVRPSIEIVSALRRARIELHRGERHPFVAKHFTNLPMVPQKAARNSRPPKAFTVSDLAATDDQSMA
jgi:hypothetical protein